MNKMDIIMDSVQNKKEYNEQLCAGILKTQTK